MNKTTRLASTLLLVLPMMALVHASLDGVDERAMDQIAVPTTHLGNNSWLFHQQDGVSARVAIRMSEVLGQGNTGQDVKCLSYMVMFEDSSGVLLGHMFGQKICPAGAENPVTVSSASISPLLGADGSSDESRYYQISFSPALDQTWGSTEGTQILCNMAPVE